ncbi:hypothetical protein D0T57_14465 [Dysgonomonas sp. 511]|nr:hypothetical protein [Dysgonomonas sp. 511]
MNLYYLFDLGNEKHHSQLKKVFYYWKNHLATASMVSEATDIPQKCICRYKRELEKRGLLWEIEKGECRITKCQAWYITTNPSLVNRKLF